MDCSAEELSDPVIRQKLEYCLVCVGHAFLLDGLLKQQGSLKRF
jgi:hypothetical protein